MAVDLMARGSDFGTAAGVVKPVCGFWEYYRRYTTTAVHAAATAALTAFGLLIFIDSRFAWLAIASYVFPPVILYVTGTDAENDSDRDPDAVDRPPGAVTHRETGPSAAGSAAATDGPHTTGTDAGGDADRDFDGPDGDLDGPDRDADGTDLDFDGPDMDADGADVDVDGADGDGADADADGRDADADGDDGDTDSDSDDGDTDTDGTGSDTDSDGDDGDTDTDSDGDDGDTDTDG